MNAIAIAIGAGAPALPTPGFSLALSDSGAGAVNLTLGAGSGSATFTRAGPATCWSSSGLLLTVGSGVARSNYTELTGATYLGYWDEEARTNNCLWNRDWTNAAWTKTTMTAALDQVGIDGAANSASSLLATAGNATASQSITIAAVNRAFSVYIKRLVGTGNIQLAQDGATFTTQTIPSDNAWHRCTLVASQLNPTLTIRIVTNGDKIAVDYAALEDNGGAAVTIPGTPIATTTVAVTRNADSLSYSSTGLSGSVGSASCQFISNGAGSQYGLIGTGATTAVLGGQGSTQVFTYDGTTVVETASIAGSGVRKAASVWSGSSFAAFIDGANKATGTFAGFTLGSLLIGKRQGLSVNGGIQNVRIFTSALSDGQVASL